MKILFLSLILSSQVYAVEIIAHRGGPEGQFRDSSLQAFQHSLDNGISTLESDLHLTADGVLILSHDATYLKNPKLIISAMKLAELQIELEKLNEKLVILRELADLINKYPNAQLQLEIKYFSPWEQNKKLYKTRDEVVQIVIDKLTQLQILDRVTVSSFDQGILLAIRKKNPNVRLKYNYRGRYFGDFFGNTKLCRKICFWVSWQETLEFIKENGIEIFAPSSKLLTHPLMKVLRPVPTEMRNDRLEKPNYKIHVWTVNNMNDWKKMSEVAIDGLITDYPVMMKESFP